MSDQKKDIDVKEQTENNKENVSGGFDNVLDFCRKHIHHIAAAAVCIILLVVLIKYTGSKGTVQPTETPETTEVVLSEENVPEEYQKDAYPEINELITNYYKAYAAGDNDTLATFTDPLSEAEKGYITAFSQYVEEYRNIACYTKKGLDENSYIVSAYMEIKLKDADTAAPGLERFYVTKKDGVFVIDNLYGQFNTRMKEFDVDEDVKALLEEFNQQADVVKLRTEVEQRYKEALESDENLKKIVDTQIPDTLTVWASDQVAAAKKAEEERIAAEEAAKKAAEEEAAKKAEEEKRAAELAAAVTVFATDKVNVRAEANETAEVIGQLEFGSQTTRLEEKDGWSRIDYSDGKQGYVRSDFLALEAPAAPPAADTNAETPAEPAGNLAEGSVITAKESVILRESMGEDSKKIATVFAGEKVTVIMSYAEGWTKVDYNGKTGFIKTALLQ